MSADIKSNKKKHNKLGKSLHKIPGTRNSVRTQSFDCHVLCCKWSYLIP